MNSEVRDDPDHESEAPERAPTKARLFTFWAGGWTLVVSALIVGVLLFEVAGHLIRQRAARIGDGEHIESYRFDLSHLTVKKSELVPVRPRDFVRVLYDPGQMTVEEMEGSPKKWVRKLLVPSDRVIGISMKGGSRAYPIRVLNWHEVVNDHFGGVPIAVTLSPLTDSVSVFDRRLAGETLTFSASGILYRSNQVLYDKRNKIGTESLWCQITAKAIAGPAAKRHESLTRLPFSLVTWGEWKRVHPDTRIVKPDPDYANHYGSAPYANYYGSRDIRYPVAGYPPKVEGPLWGHVALLAGGDGSPRLVDADALEKGLAGAGKGNDLPRMLVYSLRWSWFVLSR